MFQTRTQLLLLITGIAIGVVVTLLFQPSRATAQGVRERAMYQISPASHAALVWRVNTVTGRLELCVASNATGWIKSGQVDLAGRCAAMPAPLN